jgi:uncharacterized alpha/beta hydrolase family protein
MATTIAGITINSLTIMVSKNGEITATGKYSLVSNKGKVLATQGFNGYEEIKVGLSPEWVRKVLVEVEKEVSVVIGLEE